MKLISRKNGFQIFSHYFSPFLLLVVLAYIYIFYKYFFLKHILNVLYNPEKSEEARTKSRYFSCSELLNELETKNPGLKRDDSIRSSIKSNSRHVTPRRPNSATIDAVFLEGSKLLYKIWPPKWFFCTAIFTSFESRRMYKSASIRFFSIIEQKYV